MQQITTKQVKEWGSVGYNWKGQKDKVSGGGFMCVDSPEMTDRGAPETIVEKRVEVVEQQEMTAGVGETSGLKYAGGPAKEPA